MPDMAGFVESSGPCTYVFNETEIQQTVDGQASDARNCVQNCHAQFLDPIASGWNTSFAPVCQELTSAPTASLWPLYWCDATLCGVWINPNGGLQQDPNVDWIINSCQDIGYHSVLDPGPPPATFTCGTTTGQTVESAVSTVTRWGHPMIATTWEFPATTEESVSSPSGTVMDTILTSELPSGEQHTIFGSVTGAQSDSVTTTSPTPEPPTTFPTSAKPTVQLPAGSGLSSTASTVPKATASDLATLVPDSKTSTTSNSAALSSNAKVAIAVCSALALVLLISAAVLLFRRRRRRRKSAAYPYPYPHPPAGGLRKRRGGSRLRLTTTQNNLPQSGSPTPLISPTQSASAVGTDPPPPLTPPLRLRDRKFLVPSILRSSRSSSPPLTPLTPAAADSRVFLPSPVASRHERSPKLYGGEHPYLPRSPPAAAFVPPGTGSKTSGSRAAPVPPQAGSLSSSMTPSSPTMTVHSSLRYEVPPGSATVTAAKTVPTTTAAAAAAAAAAASASPPGSPTHPSRPRDRPLEISDLLTPGPGSATWSSPYDNIPLPPLPAVPEALFASPVPGRVARGRTRFDAHMHHTESHAGDGVEAQARSARRERTEYWAGWGEVDGGGVGVARTTSGISHGGDERVSPPSSPSAVSKSRTVSPVVSAFREEDLESLAGKY